MPPSTWRPMRLALNAKATRQAFARDLAGTLGTSPRNVRVGPLRRIRAGDAALAWQVTLRTKLGSMQVVLGVAVVDRVVCTVVMASEPHKRALVADAGTLVAASADHAHQGLLPKSAWAAAHRRRRTDRPGADGRAGSLEPRDGADRLRLPVGALRSVRRGLRADPRRDRAGVRAHAG